MGERPDLLCDGVLDLLVSYLCYVGLAALWVHRLLAHDTSLRVYVVEVDLTHVG